MVMHTGINTARGSSMIIHQLYPSFAHLFIIHLKYIPFPVILAADALQNRTCTCCRHWFFTRRYAGAWGWSGKPTSIYLTIYLFTWNQVKVIGLVSINFTNLFIVSMGALLFKAEVRGSTRRVFINQASPEGSFCNNRICNSKYNWFTFLPLTFNLQFGY
jgi:hypothetical protein